MNYTQSIGNAVELKCMLRFMELGYECSIPYGNGAKYDFIADVNGQLLRIQCKASQQVRKSNGQLDDAIQFSTVSQTTNTQKTVRHRYTKEQIDFFATVHEDQVYLVPVEQCSTSKTLRFSPPAVPNQQYNKAEDYEIEKIISEANDLVETRAAHEQQQ